MAALVVKVAPGGIGKAVKLEMACPSGSDAETVNRIGAGSWQRWVTLDGPFTIGLRSTLAMVMFVLAEPTWLEAVTAVKVTR